jgi:hypothetical protein
MEDRDMEPSPHITTLLAELRIALEGAGKNFLHKVYGSEGPPWGTTFAELEDVAVAIGDEVARQIVNQGLVQQAGVSPGQGYQSCSQCGRPVLPSETAPRIMQTGVGDVEWSEPEGYCDRCRKAFFPTVQEPGD